MKCPSCGAEIGNSKFCEFCGTQVSFEMQREQEQLNKRGCPECGSSNIQFKRENQGEVRGKTSKQIIHRTVGFCRDCGATWYPNSPANAVPKKRKTWLWVLGWLCIFPVPLTILMLRKKDMKPILKYGIIAVAWIVYLLIGLSGNTSNNAVTEGPQAAESIEASENDTSTQKTTIENNSIYSNAEIVDLMNGFGTEKVGSITVSKALQADCTDEALAEWYFNWVQSNSDCYYHIIVYSDNPTKGVYANHTAAFIQKDITLIEEENGVYSIGDDAGSTYYSVDINSKTITPRHTMVDTDVIEDVKRRVDEVIPAEYKEGEQFAIDVAGIVGGSLDCNLTLINESFSNADYQSIAEQLASSIKDLDLGIGYFCIAFQSDDYTLNALSNLDDLSTDDISSITTTIF